MALLLITCVAAPVGLLAELVMGWSVESVVWSLLVGWFFVGD
jgi:hypothetical protein